MNRYITIVYQNGIVKSIKIGTTSMRKAQEFVDCINSHEIRKAFITDKDGYEILDVEEGEERSGT